MLLDEWSIESDPIEIAEGLASFDVTNAGRVDHEFVTMRTELASDALPVDGGRVDEDAGSLEVVSRIDLITPSASRTTATRLARGNYVLICNIPGHYQSGMRAGFQVQ